jgi:hypothetical protein
MPCRAPYEIGKGFGVDAADLADDDTACRQVTEVCNRIARVHPRWAEIQRFFVE